MGARFGGVVVKDGKVTIIIAAYLRADVLTVTLESLFRQTYLNWRALVIADCCPSEFRDQLQPLSDRIEFINLPIRCGQQYGPNSVGIHLAKSEYIAFLNHDDIWLDDHLERAIANLKDGNNDVFLGSAALCHGVNQPAVPERLLFSELNRPHALWCSLLGPNRFFEPASSWVIRTDLAKEVGFWQPPDKVAVTPVMDWLSRLACTPARFVFDNKVTVLKFNLHQGAGDAGGQQYRQQATWLPRLQRFLDNPSSQTREEIASDLEQAKDKGLLVREFMDGKPLVMTPGMKAQRDEFRYHRAAGLLPRLIKVKTEGLSGRSLAQTIVSMRTGEEIKTFPSVETVILQLESQNDF